MANEFVARKGIISLGDVTVGTLSGNNGEIVTLDANGKIVASGTSISGINGTVTSVTVGTGLDVANGTTTPSITLDLSELTDMTADVVGTADELILLDNGTEKRKLISEIKLGQFNNDQGWTSNVGDITGVTAGTGLSGGGSSGDVTVSIDYAGTDNFILSATDGSLLGTLEPTDKINFVDADDNVKYASVSQLPFNNFTYTHPTHAGDDIDIDTTALTGATVISDLDFNITTDGLGHVTDANGSIATRTLTLADLGYTGATDANKYVHPTHAGDDISVDTGVLTGATVISDLDFNVTTDTLGHVTDANAAISTRNLTLADLGYTGTTDANTYVHPNHTGDVTSTGDGATVIANSAVTTAKIADDAVTFAKLENIASSTIVGRVTATAGNAEELTATQVRTLLNVEDGADVTDVTNVKAALNQDTDYIIGKVGTNTVTIPGNLVVTGTTTTNNVETVSTSNGVIFEGNAADANELTLLAGGLTADQTVTLPDATGTLALDNGSYPNLRAQATTKGDVGLGNVENTALSTWAGSSNITTLGTIATGTWQGSAISTTYISNLSGTNTGDEPDASTTVKGIIEIANNTEVAAGTDTTRAITPSSLTSITKLGTIATGTWQGTSISTTYTDAKVTSVAAGAGINVSSTTGAVTVSAEAASATNAGIIEIATNTEVTAGTDTDRAITPSSLTSITKLGTIGTGTWQGTKIASAYLDNDTAHLSTTQTFSGTKTFSSSDGVEIESDGTKSTVTLSSSETSTINGSGATTALSAVTTSTDLAIFYDYRLKGPSGAMRAGTVIATYDADDASVTFTEFSSDNGDTTPVELNVIQASGVVTLQATNNSGDVYSANVFVRTV